MRIPLISLIAAGSLALGGCAYGGLGNGLSVGLGYGNDPYGYGYGSPYGGYGYGSPYGGYGYSSRYGGYGYGSPYFGYGYSSRYGGSPYGGFGYGSPYFGWYDGFYYPGVGSYVYDTYRRPRVWTNSQQRYWSQQRQRAARSGTVTVRSGDWSGFRRARSGASYDRVGARAQVRAEQKAERANRRMVIRERRRADRESD